MHFGELIRSMAAAACAGDGKGVAACFKADGVYHDVFYGAFKGRERIAEMIHGYFHRDAKAFRWDIHAPVANGRVGYARYVFSYESTLPGYEGKRTMFEGVAVVTLEDEMMATYREVANTAPALLELGFADERVLRICRKQCQELAARDEATGHL